MMILEVPLCLVRRIPGTGFAFGGGPAVSSPEAHEEEETLPYETLTISVSFRGNGGPKPSPSTLTRLTHQKFPPKPICHI